MKLVFLALPKARRFRNHSDLLPRDLAIAARIFLLSSSDSLALTLAGGNSIRAIEGITGVHRDTIVRLAVRVGQACAKVHDETMRAAFSPLSLFAATSECEAHWGIDRPRESSVGTQ